MRTRIALIAILLLAAGTFTWRYVQTERDRPGGAGDRERDHSGRAQPPLLEGDMAGASVREQQNQPAEDGTTASSQMCVIEGHVLGLAQSLESGERAALGPVLVRTEMLHPSSDCWINVTGPVRVDGQDGRFRIQWAGAPETVRLTIDHPGYMRLERDVAAKEFRREADGSHACNITLSLTVACGVTGRVLREDGEPLHGVTVALLADVPPSAEQRVVEHAGVDKEGRWRLRSARAGSFILVALADGGYRPTAVPVLLRAREMLEGPDLVLRGGAAITGTLRIGGQPAEGAQFVAEPLRKDRSTTFGVRYYEVCRTAEGVDWCPAYDAFGPTDQLGRFGILGLSPGAYRLRVESGGDNLLLHRDVAEQFQKDVVAPATDLAFDVPVGWFDINVTAGGEPAGWTTIGLASYFDVPGAGPDQAAVWDAMSRSTDAEGRVRIAVSPGQRYGLAVYGPDKAQNHTELTGPAAGETLVIHVERPKPQVRPGLEVTFVGDGVAMLSEAYVTTFSERPQPGQSITPGGPRLPAVIDGVLRVDKIDALPWLYIVPGGGVWSARSLWQPVVEEVRWPTTGTQKVTVKLVAGAGLDLEVRSPDGGHAKVDVKLLDAGGRDTKVSWVQHMSGRGLLIDGSGIESPARAFPPLESGTYTLVVSTKGQPPLEQELQLKAGENHRVELVYGD